MTEPWLNPPGARTDLHGMPLTTGAAITAVVRPRLMLRATSEIELRYDGSQPPLGLLADLAAPSERLLTLVVPVAEAGEALRRLADVGRLRSDDPEVWTAEIRYRGQRTRTDHAARRLVLAVPEGVDAAAVLAPLAGLTVWSSQVRDGASG